MNCPQCEQIVGPDSFAVGGWKVDNCANCSTPHEVRDVWIFCRHCGVFHAIEHRPTGHVSAVRLIDKNPRLLHRARRHIAALEHAEVPA